MKKLAASKIKQATAILLKKQGHRCPLCKSPLNARSKKRPALDHCHTTGNVRDVLCLNCNGIEGKVLNRINRAKADLTVLQWAQNLVDYWERHATSQHGLVHHTHKTPEQKRERVNKMARLRRAKLKAMK